MSLQLTDVKEKQSEKVSTNLKPDESLMFKESKEERTLFKQLLMSIIGLLIFACCFSIRRDVTIQ